MSVRSYRDLIAWRKAMDLAAGVYRVTETFPAREQFGLLNQMRRASVSIPSNIAERRKTMSISCTSLAVRCKNLKLNCYWHNDWFSHPNRKFKVFSHCVTK